MNENESRLIDAPETRRSLERMAARLTAQKLWHEDLVQEALIHLWQEECRCPDQSVCWYLRGCQFHLLNQLRLGRSIDSPRRRNGHVLFTDGENGAGSLAESLPDAVAVASAGEVVMARDLLSALLPWLDLLEKEVLPCLLNGMSARETARRLRISHTHVLKIRRKIAALVMRLEPDLHPGAQMERRSSGGHAFDSKNVSAKKVYIRAAGLLPSERRNVPANHQPETP